MRAIVTGANGFLGSHVVKELIAHGIPTVAIYRENRNNNIAVSPLVTQIALNAGNMEQLTSEKITADVFFHFAWNGVAGTSRADVKQQLENVMTTVSCVKIARAIGCKRFIYAGSITEDEALAACASPGSEPGAGYIYGAAKQAANHISKMAAAECSIEHIAGKLPNIYGAGELSPKMYNMTLRRIIAGDPVKCTAGGQNYDFVYISDAARAFRLIAELGKPFHEYYIGSGSPRPLRDFLLEMREVIAPEYEFDFGSVPFTGISLPIEKYDTSLIREQCDFIPNVSFRDGIQRTYRWLVSEPLNSNIQNKNIWET